MISILNEKNKNKLKKAGCAIVTGALILSLTGCDFTVSREVSTNANTNYDVIDTMSEESLEKGITQVLDVPGQDFKLVVFYKCELENGERWTITSNKELYMEIRTDGLPDNIHVYIDNIHTDTSICSHFPTVDGITQDTMDDRIHNSQMIGIPIADDNFYSGSNEIEGQNLTFISGSMYGFNGYQHGSFSEKRFVESDYLDHAVTANKISSVIDLIIVDGDKTSCVSVTSKVKVSVWPYIPMQKSDGTSYYEYYYFDDITGTVLKEEVSEEEYLERIQSSSKELIKEKDQ